MRAFRFSRYPRSRRRHFAVIHTVMDFTVVPERLQSSFGLLRMSHLLLQVSFPHSRLFSPLVHSCFFYSFLSISLLFLDTAHVHRGLPRLIMKARTGEQAGRIEGVSTLERGLSAMIRPANYLSAGHHTPTLAREQIKHLGMTCPRFYATLNS